jgi:hypothetical protein
MSNKKQFEGLVKSLTEETIRSFWALGGDHKLASAIEETEVKDLVIQLMNDDDFTKLCQVSLSGNGSTTCLTENPSQSRDIFISNFWRISS